MFKTADDYDFDVNKVMISATAACKKNENETAE